MKKRIFIRKEGSVYVYRLNSGDTEYYADSTNWKIYKLREKLLEYGVDEDELNELLELKYQEAKEDFEMEDV